MKSIKHRLLSLLLTLVTILSLLPTAAFAASNTGSGLKITTNQAYWSTRLLANGTPYSYRPPLVDGKLVYCMDSGLGYHYATASYLNSFTWTSGTGADADMLIDTVGMSTLFLPDLQYHFHDMDPNWVVNHAYNVASYILEHDNPIQDGETIDGVADGQMCREIQWKCQYEDALIQPPRGVLDINMGNYASGGR